MVDSPPEISVIIPAYQGRSTIRQCLASVMKAVEGWSCEVLVIESSGDGSVEIVQDCFPRVEVIASAFRLTAGQARNMGIQRARGRWLFCVDQDCLVPSDWIERLLHHLDKPGVGAAGGSMAVANRDNISGWCVYFLEFFNHFPHRLPRVRRDNFLIGANSAWRAEVFQKVTFPDQTLGEDLLLSQAVRRLGLAVVYDPSISVCHYNRSGWREFRRYSRAMGRAAAHDQQKLGGRAIRWIERWPPLVFGVPLVVLPLIGWRLLSAPPSYGIRYLGLLPCCFAGQLLWAEAFRAEISKTPKKSKIND
jgi:GT2 family glycosyltransferase